jgi:hypothetical protein
MKITIFPFIWYVSSTRLLSERAKLIQAAKLIIWEELPMANKACVHTVDALLRLLCAINKPFSGKPFIVLELQLRNMNTSVR